MTGPVEADSPLSDGLILLMVIMLMSQNACSNDFSNVKMVHIASFLFVNKIFFFFFISACLMISVPALCFNVEFP